MEKRLLLVFAGFFLLLSLFLVSASTYSPQYLYPEDLSWKSGLVKEVTIKDAQGNIVQQTLNHWNSRYLFEDPTVQGYLWDDRIDDAYGFSARLIRTEWPIVSLGSSSECEGYGVQECGSDIGMCTSGWMICTESGASTCLGSIEATSEEPWGCDGLDQDCNGIADNGVIDCGGVSVSNEKVVFDKLMYGGSDATALMDPIVSVYDGLRYGAKFSANLVSLPYLEATESVVYDSQRNYKAFAQFDSFFDEYGNPRKTTNLGYTGRPYGGTFSKSYSGGYEVRDPKSINPEDNLLVYPEYTNLEGELNHNDDFGDAVEDNILTETIYLHEVEDNTWTYSPEYYGWVLLPVASQTFDYAGRILGMSITEYFENPSELKDCVYDQDTASLYFCENDQSGAGFNNRWDCPGLAPTFVYSSTLEIKGDNYLKDNDFITFTKFAYDKCGNVLETEVASKYEHFPRPIDKEENENYNGDLYRNKALVSYNKLGAPLNVEVYDPHYVDEGENPLYSIENSAEYYGDGAVLWKSTNERGVNAQVDYDNLGRVISSIGPYDSVEKPGSTYEYLYDVSSGRNYIFERVKLDESSNNYAETYYFYDGMGRLVQTQTKDAEDESFILTGILYDGMNRVLREYRPLRVNLENGFGEFLESFVTSGTVGLQQTSWIEYNYDALGRVTKVYDTTNPEDVYSTSSYGISGQFDYVEQVDPNENKHTYWNDAQGALAGVELPTI
ncbi:MAG: hypothetical protein ABIH59_02225 [archaeon]